MKFLERLKLFLDRGKKGETFTPVDAHERTSLLVGTRFDYAAAVRNGLDSNVVMAPVQWIMRTFPEAEPIVERKRKKQWLFVDEHELTSRLARPNAFYSGTVLLQATCISWFLDGNAYWLKVRGRFGNVTSLWYVPHWLIEPKWPQDGSAFVTHYEYLALGQRRSLRVDDVVHLRFGLDPRSPRLGLSPLKSLMREVYTDEEAANFTSSILRNMGVPGIVVSPKDASVQVSAEDVKATKDYIGKQWSGDHRGEPLVMGQPTDLKQFGFDPNSLQLGNIRDIAEERVCAAIGIPAAVVGFGAGLQQTKVGATMRELRRLAWVQCILPTQRSMAEQLSAQLMPDFESQVNRFRVRFDASQVSAFQEEETEKTKRVVMKVQSGLQRIDLGQEELGMEPDPSQAIYLRPVNLQAIGLDGEPVVRPNEDVVPASSDDDAEIDTEAMARELLARRGASNGTGAEA